MEIPIPSWAYSNSRNNFFVRYSLSVCQSQSCSRKHFRDVNIMSVSCSQKSISSQNTHLMDVRQHTFNKILFYDQHWQPTQTHKQYLRSINSQKSLNTNKTTIQPTNKNHKSPKTLLILDFWRCNLFQAYLLSHFIACLDRYDLGFV